MSDNNEAVSPIDDGVVAAASIGCPEARLFMNRRNVLAGSVGLFTWAMMPRAASAANADDPRLLVVLLRGGMDGLNVVANTIDPNYATLRGEKLALNSTTSSDLGISGYSGYRINNLVPQFKAMLAAGEAKVVLPIAPPLRTRSHFDCSFNLENGYDAGSIAHDGWLNRVLTAMRPSANELPPSQFATVSIGNTPTILMGSEKVLTWSPNFFANDFFTNPTLLASQDRYDDPLSALYHNSGHQDLAAALKAGLEMDLMARSNKALFSGLNSLQSTFVAAAALLNKEHGPRIAVVTVNNFDAHIGESDNSTRILGNFDSSLGKFKDTMGTAWSKTVVVCVTEFGRTVTENGYGGSDHGTGTVALLAGGALSKSNKIIGGWPSLSGSNLLDNKDIIALYDTRALFKAVLGQHLRVSDASLDAVFPNTGNGTAVNDQQTKDFAGLVT